MIKLSTVVRLDKFKEAKLLLLEMFSIPGTSKLERVSRSARLWFPSKVIAVEVVRLDKSTSVSCGLLTIAMLPVLRLTCMEEVMGPFKTKGMMVMMIGGQNGGGESNE